tara:strand:+ start:155 stop:577 length:423 start_codon:yes stop_codon:yes gene_type:complete
MANGKKRVRKNPVAGGRPAYDEAPVTNIPRAEGDPTGQSKEITDAQKGAPMAREAEQGVQAGGGEQQVAGVTLPSAFGPGATRVPINNMQPDLTQRSMQPGLQQGDIDLLLEEVMGIVPSYETAALMRRGAQPNPNSQTT